MDGWCHIEGWEVVKRMQGPCFLYVGALGKLPNRFKGRRGGVGGSPGKSLLTVLHNSARFQTTQHNCLPLLGHRACMFTYCLDTISVFSQKNTSCRKETLFSSSQILKTTKKPILKVFSLSNFILPWNGGAVRAAKNVSLKKLDSRQTKVTASFSRMRLLWNSRDF